MTDTEKLQKIAKLIASEVKAQPVKASVEESLRAAAADWMETEIGYAYGQTVLDIINGN